MIRVEGYPNLYRDEKTGAIINHDNSSYNVRLKTITSLENDKKRKAEESSDE